MKDNIKNKSNYNTEVKYKLKFQNDVRRDHSYNAVKRNPKNEIYNDNKGINTGIITTTSKKYSKSPLHINTNTYISNLNNSSLLKSTNLVTKKNKQTSNTPNRMKDSSLRDSDYYKNNLNNNGYGNKSVSPLHHQSKTTKVNNLDNLGREYGQMFSNNIIKKANENTNNNSINMLSNDTNQELERIRKISQAQLTNVTNNNTNNLKKSDNFYHNLNESSNKFNNATFGKQSDIDLSMNHLNHLNNININQLSQNDYNRKNLLSSQNNDLNDLNDPSLNGSLSDKNHHAHSHYYSEVPIQNKLNTSSGYSNNFYAGNNLNNSNNMNNMNKINKNLQKDKIRKEILNNTTGANSNTTNINYSNSHYTNLNSFQYSNNNYNPNNPNNYSQLNPNNHSQHNQHNQNNQINNSQHNQPLLIEHLNESTSGKPPTKKFSESKKMDFSKHSFSQSHISFEINSNLLSEQEKLKLSNSSLTNDINNNQSQNILKDASYFKENFEKVKLEKDLLFNELQNIKNLNMSMAMANKSQQNSLRNSKKNNQEQSIPYYDSVDTSKIRTSTKEDSKYINISPSKNKEESIEDIHFVFVRYIQKGKHMTNLEEECGDSQFLNNYNTVTKLDEVDI